MALSTGGFAYMLFCEASWLTYPLLPAPALLEVVHPGETVPLLIKRHSSAGGKRNYTMSRELHCDSLSRPVMLPSVVLSVEPGDTERPSYIHEIPLVVPNEYGQPMPMPTGNCMVSGMSEVQGLVRNNIPVYWYSTQFKVVAR